MGDWSEFSIGKVAYSIVVRPPGTRFGPITTTNWECLVFRRKDHRLVIHCSGKNEDEAVGRAVGAAFDDAGGGEP